MREFPCWPQDATKLEMGRTYEQVDRGVVTPRSRGAAPTEREQQLAAGVSSASAPATGKVQRVRALLGKVFK